jgi:plastocyanin
MVLVFFIIHVKSFLQVKNITNTLLFLLSSSSFSILLLLSLFSFYPYFANAQEEVITIVPGSSDSSRYRFFDITEYPISLGKEIKWYNADNIVHKIVITSSSLGNSSNENDTIAQSENIKPNEFFSYQFDKEGEYLFESPKYDWMKGKIIVTDDIKTIKKNMKENDIDVYISWIPSTIKLGEKSIFKIIFLDKKSEKNQEHIDYSFTIQNPSSSSSSNKVLYKNAITHSAWGVEPASHVFDSGGTFIGKLGIEGILFQPIDPEYTEFEIQVTE